MNILVISEEVSPVNSVAAIRWTKISKYLSINWNYSIDILTTKKHYRNKSGATFRKYDSTLANDLVYISNYIEIKESARTRMFDLSFRLADIAIKGFRLIRGFANNKTSSTKSKIGCNESPMYLRIYGKCLEKKGDCYLRSAMSGSINWQKYDVIISSFGPSWVHKLANQIKTEYPNILWIADFRDPTAGIPDVPRSLKDKYVSFVCKNADAVTATSDGTLRALNVPNNIKSQVITNGFEPQEMDSRLRRRNDKFIISYTGTMYKEGDRKSDLTPLFDALTELVLDKDIDKNDILIIYIGRSSDLFQKQICKYSELNWENRGWVSREESMDLQDSSSLLVISVWNTKSSNGVIAAKLFEYFCSDVPLLGLCSGDLSNSTTKRIISCSKMGYCYEEASKEKDYTELKEYVKNKYLEWKAFGFSKSEANREFIDSFSYEQIANKYNELIGLLHK